MSHFILRKRIVRYVEYSIILLQGLLTPSPLQVPSTGCWVCSAWKVSQLHEQLTAEKYSLSAVKVRQLKLIYSTKGFTLANTYILPPPIPMSAWSCSQIFFTDLHKCQGHSVTIRAYKFGEISSKKSLSWCVLLTYQKRLPKIWMSVIQYLSDNYKYIQLQEK